MVASDKQFAGSIPDIYDRFLVPLIFEPYARDLAARLAKASPRDVLETAAGTGVVTRAIAARLPKSTHITATDLNQPMQAYINYFEGNLVDQNYDEKELAMALAGLPSVAA